MAEAMEQATATALVATLAASPEEATQDALPGYVTCSIRDGYYLDSGLPTFFLEHALCPKRKGDTG